MALTRGARDEQDAPLLAARVAVAEEVEVVVVGPAAIVAVADLRKTQRPDPRRGHLRVGLRARWIGEVGDGFGDGVGWSIPGRLEGCGGCRGCTVFLACTSGGDGLRWVAEGIGGGIDTYSGAAVKVGFIVDASRLFVELNQDREVMLNVCVMSLALQPGSRRPLTLSPCLWMCCYLGRCCSGRSC